VHVGLRLAWRASNECGRRSCARLRGRERRAAQRGQVRGPPAPPRTRAGARAWAEAAFSSVDWVRHGVRDQLPSLPI